MYLPQNIHIQSFHFTAKHFPSILSINIKMRTQLLVPAFKLTQNTFYITHNNIIS